jgi:hypothetical protein
MPMLAKYHLTDGLIQGVWNANNTALLEAQVVPEDPIFGYLVLVDQDAQVLQEQYYIIAGQLAAKPNVVLTATPTPFPADGATVCRITVLPFVACTVLVNVTPYALVPEDQAVLLTSDVPMVFQVSLPHQSACWGSPLTIEAV